MSGSNRIDPKRLGQFGTRGDYTSVTARYVLPNGPIYKIELKSDAIEVSISESSSGSTISPISLSPTELWDLVKGLGKKVKLEDRKNANP